MKSFAADGSSWIWLGVTDVCSGQAWDHNKWLVWFSHALSIQEVALHSCEAQPICKYYAFLAYLPSNVQFYMEHQRQPTNRIHRNPNQLRSEEDIKHTKVALVLEAVPNLILKLSADQLK